MREVSQHQWLKVQKQEDAHEKAESFHDNLISLLDKHFPKKTKNDLPGQKMVQPKPEDAVQ